MPRKGLQRPRGAIVSGLTSRGALEPGDRISLQTVAGGRIQGPLSIPPRDEHQGGRRAPRSGTTSVPHESWAGRATSLRERQLGRQSSLDKDIFKIL
jgi:hypothetical protein